MRRTAPPINSMERKEPPHNHAALAAHYAENLPLISQPVKEIKMKINIYEIIIILIIPFVLLGIYSYSMSVSKNFLFDAENRQIAEIEDFLHVIKQEDPKETQNRLIILLEGIKAHGDKKKERDIALFNTILAHFKLQLVLSLIWCLGLSVFFIFKKRKSL